MNSVALLLAVVPLALAACVDLEATRRASMRDVQESLEARTGRAPMTPANASEAEIRSAVEDLLRHDLTEENAVRIALLNNHDVRAGYERLGIAAADLVQKGLLRNPVLGGEALLGLGGGSETVIGFAQPFVDLFWLPLRQRAAEHELRAAAASLTRELVQLTFAVRRELVRVRTAEQLVETGRRSLAAAAAGHELAKELAAAGNAVGAQLSAARLLEGRARLDLADAERNAVEAREPLNALLGLWGSRVAWRVAATDSIQATEHVAWDEVEARAVAASLALREIRARIDAAAQDARVRSWSSWLPDGVVGMSARRDPSGQEALGPWLAVELPIFDNGTAATSLAEARVRMLLHRHAQIAVEVRARARALRERTERIEERRRFAELEYLPTQDRLLHETMQNYNAMQIGAFDVLEQKLRQLDAVREVLVSSREARLARLELDELLAGGQPQGSMANDAIGTEARATASGAGDHE